MAEPVETVSMTLDEALNANKVGFFQYRLLLLCGLAFMCDALQLSLLSFTSICAGDEWNLNDAEIASVTSVVFIGTLCGSLFWGIFADRYGRKPAFLSVCVIITMGAIVAGFAPNYYVLISCGFVTGFGIGGANIPFDLLAEFLPQSYRGTFLLNIEYFWTLGSLFVAGVAWALLGKLGWRALVFITAVPVAVNSVFAAIYLPESPKWLILKGRGDEAEKVVRNAALVNGQVMEPFTLIDDETHEPGEGEDGNYYDLIKTKGIRKISIPLWVIWGVFGFTYYGLILLVARIYNKDSDDDDDAAGDDSKCSFDYADIFINATSEIVGVFVATLLIDRLGRRLTQSGFYLLAGLSVGSIGLGLSPDMVLTVAMVGRCCIMGASCATWVMTPEVYSTKDRTTGHAMAVTVSKLCAFLSPYAIVSSLTSLQLGILMGTLNCLAAGCTFLLPETSGVDMEEMNYRLIGDLEPSDATKGSPKHQDGQQGVINDCITDVISPLSSSVLSNYSVDTIPSLAKKT